MNDKFCDLVCEGGGIKGIALLGAIYYLNEQGYEFKKIAGTSAGAIVASLLAVGYKGNELKDILNNYNPKIVVWGKNDIKALNDFYKLHKVSALTNSNNFVDLLRLHKNFFNLKNDLGLFNAYKEYYLEDPIQAHDAIEDAKVTKAVFSAFKKYAKHLILNLGRLL